jgi:hypothetical protein
MFARDWGDPPHSLQAYEGCTGMAGAEPHAKETGLPAAYQMHGARYGQGDDSGGARRGGRRNDVREYGKIANTPAAVRGWLPSGTPWPRMRQRAERMIMAIVGAMMTSNSVLLAAANPQRDFGHRVRRSKPANPFYGGFRESATPSQCE